MQLKKQEELVDLLKKDGYDVTQTTVSRDIRELKLFKVLDANGVYKYAISESNPDHFETRISSVFRHSVLRVDHSGNIKSVFIRSKAWPMRPPFDRFVKK
jgi:transcriptional regulator of arginine metabolism